jgi:hypothetical protein
LKCKQPSFISNYLQVLAGKNKTGMSQGAIKWRPEFWSSSTDNDAVSFYCPALGNAFTPVFLNRRSVSSDVSQTAVSAY